MIRRKVQAVLVILLLVLLFRVTFDIKTYFFGSTLVVRGAAEQGYDYVVRLPKGYHDFGAKRPLLVFLHGSGETSRNVRTLVKRDPFRCVQGKISPADFPFIVVSPISPDRPWSPARIEFFLNALVSDKYVRYRLDPDRIYLTGHSMGGYATFQIASEFPDKFAAIVPVAGGYIPKFAPKLKTVPTWAFHGSADDVISCEDSERIIEAMQEVGAEDAHLTILPDKGHGITEDVYSQPEIYRWFLKNKRPNKM